MSSEKIRIEIERKGQVGVTFTRPDKHNVLDDDVITRLDSLFEELSHRQDVHVVVFRGEGKSFCAGADIKWMARAGSFSADENMEDAGLLATMLYKLYTLPQMTIARVQGRAMGGGLGMVACCDLVVTEQQAEFAFPEVKLGLTPATIAPYVISAIGARNAKRYFQTAEKFPAQRAYEMGLAHELLKDEKEMDDFIQEALSGLSCNGPHAVAASKKLCLDLTGRKISEDVAKDTAARLAIIRSGPEAREGLDAFLNKRKPKFKDPLED